jgi:hypothetical protein
MTVQSLVEYFLTVTGGKDENNNQHGTEDEGEVCTDDEAFMEDEVYIENEVYMENEEHDEDVVNIEDGNETSVRRLRSSDKKTPVIPSCLSVDDDLRLGLYVKLVKGKVRTSFLHLLSS